jgi:hypothetical protein
MFDAFSAVIAIACAPAASSSAIVLFSVSSMNVVCRHVLRTRACYDEGLLTVDECCND